MAKLIPSIRKKIEDELSTISKNFRQEVEERTKHLSYITELPQNKLSKKEIVEILNKNLGLGKFYYIISYEMLRFHNLQEITIGKMV